MQVQDLVEKGGRRVEAEICLKKKKSYTPKICQGRRERIGLL